MKSYYEHILYYIILYYKIDTYIGIKRHTRSVSVSVKNIHESIRSQPSAQFLEKETIEEFPIGSKKIILG